MEWAKPGRNANRQVEGERALRAARPDLGSVDFGCEKNSTLAYGSFIERQQRLSIPKRP